jgi:hypothetical protein
LNLFLTTSKYIKDKNRFSFLFFLTSYFALLSREKQD